LGFFDRFLRKRRRTAARYQDEGYPEGPYQGRYDYEGPEETEDSSLLVDHHFEFIPSDDYERHVSGMEYVIEVRNGTDYPMGNLRVKLPPRIKLGSFGEPVTENRMLDPDESLTIKVPFRPSYHGGKEEFEFEILFFDFRYKVEERVVLRSEPVKVVVPKFIPEMLDEDRFRFMTGDLYRWTLETDIVKHPPGELYRKLRERMESIGFKEANELLNEKGFRGISQLAATDKKGRKWAVQIQVIGQGKESKLLLYTFGERPEYAYNLAVKVLLKFEERDLLMDALVMG